MTQRALPPAVVIFTCPLTKECWCCVAAAAMALQFPKSLAGDVVRQIHHSTLRKDDLISKVHASLKQGSPGADKENGQQDSPAAAASSSQAAPVTKKLLTQFLIYVSAQ